MELNDKTLYKENSIESLNPLQFTRLRPQVYCGDISYATQLVVEIVSNAVDEFRLGHGDLIEVAINHNNAVRVRDYGQGFLVNSKKEDGTTVLERAFSRLNTSGKYREDGLYEGTSLGSFGIGSKLATFLSHWLDVYTYRDGMMEHCHFDEGVFANREVQKTTAKTGTLVEWQPSEEFFDNTDVDISALRKLFQVIACLCPGLTIILDYKGTKDAYLSKNGLNDLAEEAVKGKEIVKNRLNIAAEDGKYKIDLVMTYMDSYSSTIVAYVNTGLTESGPHITQIKTLITREMNKFFRDRGWLKAKDANLTGDDCQEGMYLVFNITAPGVGYDSQIKSRITKLDMKPFNTILSNELSYWFAANEKDLKTICDKALNARKARAAAKKARDAVREPKGKKEKILNLPTKLVDAWSNDRMSCELLICEGDSAAAGLVSARDSSYQAVFPIRGKIINLFKNTTEKAFANQEVVNIIKALGLDLDAKTHQLVYSPSKLRYGKIILAADADPDGQAIRNLLLTFFWAICPELVQHGHIYIAIPPLFRVTTKKNEYIYFRDASALEEYKAQQHKGENYLVSRNKG